MAQRDVMDLQEAMECAPVMDTLWHLAVVSSFRLCGPFHIPVNIQETWGIPLAPKPDSVSLSGMASFSSLEGSN